MWSQGSHYQVYKELLDGAITLPNLGKHYVNLKNRTETQPYDRSLPILNQQLLIALSANSDLSRLIINGANQGRYYGTPSVSQLEPAVARLDCQELSDLITLFAIRDLIIPDNLPANHIIRDLWEETLHVSSICAAICARLARHNHTPIKHGLLAGLVYQVGTIMLLNTYRNKGLSIPNRDHILNIPGNIVANVSSLAAIQWQLSPVIHECALRRNQYHEVNFDAFSIIDVLHMAIIVHRNTSSDGSKEVELKNSFPFIKAVKNRLIQEEADHFSQMIKGHSLLIFQGLTPLITKFPNHNPHHYRTTYLPYQKLG
ncbi:HDOD domain-containing protein [Litoribacillus peritrichatus]|uniref:HDOD domain-containing protein n=1 Tax=Litoribacillus peritrichatus TaxID=718191 RepID=A0ABP7ND57_9GAMM